MGEKWDEALQAKNEALRIHEAHQNLYEGITGHTLPRLLPIERLNEIDHFLEQACSRAELTTEQRLILITRYGVGVNHPPLDQQQTGRILNLTPEHVRNQEKRARQKLTALYKLETLR